MAYKRTNDFAAALGVGGERISRPSVTSLESESAQSSVFFSALSQHQGIIKRTHQLR